MKETKAILNIYFLTNRWILAIFIHHTWDLVDADTCMISCSFLTELRNLQALFEV